MLMELHFKAKILTKSKHKNLLCTYVHTKLVLLYYTRRGDQPIICSKTLKNHLIALDLRNMLCKEKALEKETLAVKVSILSKKLIFNEGAF